MKKILIAMCFFSLLNIRAFAQELSLDDSISLALSNSESIDAASARRDRSRHELSSVRRSLGLRVSWDTAASRIGGGYYASYRRAYNPGSYNPYIDDYVSSGDAYTNSFDNTFTAQYPIYTGGQAEGRIKSAGFSSASADLNVERTRQDIRFQTEQAYYDLLQRQNLLNVAENASKMAEEKLSLITIQYEEGAAPMADVLQMQVQLASYKQEQVTAKGNYEVAMYRLARLVGKMGEELVLKDKLEYEPFPYTLAEAEEFAIKNRPDKIIGEFNIMGAKSRLSAAKSGYRPKVNAVYTRNIVDNKGFLRDGRNEMWSLGVRASWNVFDNAVTEADVAAAKADVTQAEAEEKNIAKTVILETRSAYAQMKSAETNIKAAEIAVQQARESYEISSVRYEEGVDNLLAVTTAQERLTRAETNYYTALYSYNLYKAQLEKAVGVPVLLNVESYGEFLNNNPKSAKNLDKIAKDASK